MPGDFMSRKPYGFPGEWEDLKGPDTGAVRLPLMVDWSPTTNEYGLSDVGQARIAYRSLLSEGSVEQVCGLVNGRLPESAWPHLTLPRTVSAEWHARFPGHLSADPMLCRG